MQTVNRVKQFCLLPVSKRNRELVLMSSRVSLTSWGEGTTLALVGHPSSDGFTMKIPSGVDVLLHQPDSHPIFSHWVG